MILYFDKELCEDGDFLSWKNKYSESVRSVEEMTEINYEDSILIASTEASVAYAKGHNMAVLGYQPVQTNQSDMTRQWDRPYLSVSYVVEGFEEIDLEYIDRVYRRHHKLPWMILETERTYLREFFMADLDALFDLYDKPDVTDYVEPLYEYEEEKSYEECYIKNQYEYKEFGMWLVFSKENNELIGRAGFENTPDGENIEMGYLIAPEYQGRGYGSEVCRAIVEYAKENTYYEKIYVYIDEKNTASIALARKIGFEFEGIEESNSENEGRVMQKYVKSLKA